ERWSQNTGTNVFKGAIPYKQSVGRQWEDAGGTRVTSFNNRQRALEEPCEPLSKLPPRLGISEEEQPANGRQQGHVLTSNLDSRRLIFLVKSRLLCCCLAPNRHCDSRILHPASEVPQAPWRRRPGPSNLIGQRGREQIGKPRRGLVSLFPTVYNALMFDFRFIKFPPTTYGLEYSGARLDSTVEAVVERPHMRLRSYSESRPAERLPPRNPTKMN